MYNYELYDNHVLPTRAVLAHLCRPSWQILSGMDSMYLLMDFDPTYTSFVLLPMLHCHQQVPMGVPKNSTTLAGAWSPGRAPWS